MLLKKRTRHVADTAAGVAGLVLGTAVAAAAAVTAAVSTTVATSILRAVAGNVAGLTALETNVNHHGIMTLPRAETHLVALSAGCAAVWCWLRSRARGGFASGSWAC